MTALGLLQAAGQAPDSVHWTARAIQDTVAAIARQAAYERRLTTTWMERALAWVLHWLGRLLTPLGAVDMTHVVLILAVALALLLGAHFFVAARADASAWNGSGRRASAGGGRDYWAEAQAFAAAGDFTLASHALYAALLTRLAGRGAVRLHPSKTAGDYARELRRRGAPEQQRFQAFRGRYDRLIYGAGACSADDYAALVMDAGFLLERVA